MSSSEDLMLSEVNPWVLSSYMFYSTLLVIKLLMMPILTSVTRRRCKIACNPEDTAYLKGFKATGTHPLLTRVTRMHLNDLENIVPFLMLGLLFCFTNYSPYSRAVWHFRIFFCARVLATVCHYYALFPLRFICFLTGLIVNISLAIHVLYQAGLTTKYL